MTYLQFHLIFIVPPLVLLLWLLWRGRGAHRMRLKRWPLAAIVAIALIYTTPWDNYLVREGIWWYGEERVIGTIGYVPVEEYLFFVLQPLLAGLWLYLLLQRVTDRSGKSPSSRNLALGMGVAWVVVGVLGVWMLQRTQTRYLGLILAWAAPVLAGQWFYDGRLYLRHLGLLTAGVSAPTLYLWAADRVAIGAQIWTISPRFTTGLTLFGLPIEEAAFFLLTNLLVVQGLLLFLRGGGTALVR